MGFGLDQCALCEGYNGCMHLVYIDESGSFDDPTWVSGQTTWGPQGARQTSHFVVACVILSTEDWPKAFDRLKGLRKDVKRNYGVPLGEPLHATEVVAGQQRWRHITRRVFDRPQRISLLRYLLHEYGQWSNIRVMAAVVDKSASRFASINPSTARVHAYANLLARVERAVGGQFIIIHDGIEDLGIIRIVRTLRVYNMVAGINKPVGNIIEDPLFKKHSHSYFLQMVDHLAFGLLHAFDSRYNKDLSNLVVTSKILMNCGVARACAATSEVMPGVILVPTSQMKKA